MIASFRHKGLKKFYESGERSKLAAELVDRIEMILTLLDAAKDVEELDLPAFRLHALKGNQKGRWAVTVRANWRITFGFKGGQAVDVDFEDYH